MYSYMYIHTRILLLCCKDILQYCIVHILDNRKVLIIKKSQEPNIAKKYAIQSFIQTLLKISINMRSFDHLLPAFFNLKTCTLFISFLFIYSISIYYGKFDSIISPSPLSERRFYVMKEGFSSKITTFIAKKI